MGREICFAHCYARLVLHKFAEDVRERRERDLLVARRAHRTSRWNRCWLRRATAVAQILSRARVDGARGWLLLWPALCFVPCTSSHALLLESVVPASCRCVLNSCASSNIDASRRFAHKHDYICDPSLPHTLALLKICRSALEPLWPQFQQPSARWAAPPGSRATGEWAF